MKKVTPSPKKVKAKKERKRRKRPSSLYKVRNWSSYNKALKQRGSLTIWFPEEAQEDWYYKGAAKRGGQFTYSDLAIETALTIKAVYHLGLRQTEGMIASVVELLGLCLVHRWQTDGENTVFHRSFRAVLVDFLRKDDRTRERPPV